MKNLSKQISVIIPAYNEQGTITELIKRTARSLKKHGFTYEIIVVDDNSTDKTCFLAKKLARRYRVKTLLKKGTKGKAFSLFEGFKASKFENVAFIDADLQYLPEEIPLMAEKLEVADVVNANRKQYKDSLVRRVLSRSFRYGFGKVLFGLEHDIQAGLKVFKREVIEAISFNPSSPWTFDLEFLHNAREAGFSISNHDITFNKRKKGDSKIGILKTSYEIGSAALKLRFTPILPKIIKPRHRLTMRGAGVRYRRKKYITHTTLDLKKSSLQTFTGEQKIFILLTILLLFGGLVLNWYVSLILLVGILSFIYFADTVFNLYVVLKSLHFPQEIRSSESSIKNLDSKKLPYYTILCPLYKEAHIIPQFVKNISHLSWPKEKLDVILLLEEDDTETIKATEDMQLPTFIRVFVVPNSQPKTKPKACNYGLAYALGEYLVIYDAEDRPEKDQLKKAYLAFQRVKSNVRCLQAKLNYYNPSQNLLTRFFTAEYSLWFDITLTGLQSINTSIPLGGTSNHFRTKDLKDLKGWDPFNVTEDADLGMRLFKEGYKTAIIDSVTLEEANSKWGNWTRQRSRWIKGYMQTYLVHNRNWFSFAKSHGKHFPIFHLTIGGKIAFILINPILWIVTISYFTLYAYLGPTIESLYPAIVFYMAVSSLVFGNFLFMYCYMVGVMKREQYSLVKYTFLVPFYWLMISVAGFMALYQLFFKPFYWEKTVHGLHLIKKSKVTQKEKIEKAPIPSPVFPGPAIELPNTIKIALLPVRAVSKAEQYALSVIALTFITIGEYEKKNIKSVITVLRKFIAIPIKYAASMLI